MQLVDLLWFAGGAAVSGWGVWRWRLRLEARAFEEGVQLGCMLGRMASKGGSHVH
jgi:hypothetical protein